MPPATLDWATAEVRDASLTVEVQGELPEGWQESFMTTVKLLGHGEWGDVKIEQQRIEVGNVPAGGEDKLRHFLQGAVDQANASTGLDDDQRSERGQGAEGDDAGPDAQMTERFRSFGPSEEGEPEE